MSIGYACIALGIEGGSYKSCILKNATEERLSQLTRENINALTRITDYNRECGIRLYRIGSGIIPFGSHPEVSFHWRELFEEELVRIGERIRQAGVRVSMHPGQYTVLNSPDERVISNALLDLDYHAGVLDSLGCGSDCKIILHVGGVYGDRKAAAERFIENARKLPPNVCSRLVLENDERCFNVAQVLEIAEQLRLPVVFDLLHHSVNPAPDPLIDEIEWLRLCAGTWLEEDGVQKIHYSQQQPGGKPGAHSLTIDTEEFLRFYQRLGSQKPDIMLEVKDKDLSAKKVINLICMGGIK